MGAIPATSIIRQLLVPSVIVDEFCLTMVMEYEFGSGICLWMFLFCMLSLNGLRFYFVIYAFCLWVCLYNV